MITVGPPQMPVDVLSRAVALHRAGQLDAAAELYRSVLQRNPRQFDALHLLGVVLHQQGEPAAALRLLTQAHHIDPASVPALVNLGAVLRGLGRREQALDALTRALHMSPGHQDALANRSAVLLDLGRAEDALTDAERVLCDAPDHFAALYNRVSALQALGRNAAALEACVPALRALPRNANLFNWQGELLRAQGDVRAALTSFEHALSLEPRHVAALVNHGHAWADLGEHDAAASCYQRALELDPEQPLLPGHCMHARLKTCDWRGLDVMQARIEDGIARDEPVCEPFVALLTPLGPAPLRRCAEAHARSRWPGAAAVSDPAIRCATGAGRLRIGYFSADFHEHPTARLLVGVIEEHDRARFEVIALSFGPPARDPMRERLTAAFDRFIDVGGLSDDELVAFARALGLDIAVDLGGYTYGSRSGVFARRVAPLQLSWLGFPGTSGAPFIDYLVADPIVLPPPARRHCSEAVLSLPHSYQPNDKRRPIAQRHIDRSELGLPARGFVFCCFNNAAKIAPDVFTIWTRLLAQVAGSVLWLMDPGVSARDNLRREARQRDVDPARLVFAPRWPADEHLARHAAADLFLDTWPYNAHTTASDALWAGLPVVTRLGEHFAGRVAASLLQAAGLPELVAADAEAYEKLALTLATDAMQLAQLCKRLAEQRLRSPLFDTVGFTRHLECGYVAVVERQRQGLPAATLQLEATASP